MALSGSFGGGTIGRTTAAFGTAFYVLIPPYSTPYSVVTSPAITPFTVVTHINKTNGNTANATTVMRPIGKTTATVAANTSVAVVTVAGDPGNIATGLYNATGTNNNLAANDIMVVAHSDGTVGQYTVSAFNTTSKVITFTGNFTAPVAVGAAVWDYGIFSDTDPITGSAFPNVNGVAVSATGDDFATSGRGFASSKVGDPLLLYNPNATAQTLINYTEYTYDRGL